MRRSFYDPASAPGQGWQWEWENDAGTWTPYDMEVAIAIESAHTRQQPCLDLTPLGFCYLIDFQNMTQVCSSCFFMCRSSSVPYIVSSEYLQHVSTGEQTESEVSENPEAR